MIAPTPPDENERIAALHSLEISDTQHGERLDRITRLACCVANVPFAAISLVDRHRIRILSQQGLPAREIERRNSFCAHTILSEEPLICPDTLLDARFTDNPLVKEGEPKLRFYAGYPIHAPNRARIGTLCVTDNRPRSLLRQQSDGLAELARLVDAELLGIRLDMATRAARIGVYERSANDREIWWSEGMWEIVGQDPAKFKPTWEKWLELVHPDDRERVRASVGNAAQGRLSRSMQYRIIRPEGAICHVQSISASSADEDDAPNGSICGIMLDVTERVEAEEREFELQQQLRETSHQAGMAEIATGVLHNVGNVLNSLGIANAVARRDLKALRLDRLEQATSLLSDHRGMLATFLQEDERGQHLPDYLPALSTQLAAKVRSVQAELETMDAQLQRLREILSTQQSLAKVGALREPINLSDLVDFALMVEPRELPGVEVVRHYERLPLVNTDRHKLLQILLNLLSNARDALQGGAPSRITVRIYREANHAVIAVEDSGVGMSADVLSRLWRFGYTTKKHGHGFGLHNSANAAREIGATLTAHSDGPGAGSRFSIKLPLEEPAAESAEMLLSIVDFGAKG